MQLEDFQIILLILTAKTLYEVPRRESGHFFILNGYLFRYPYAK